MQAQDGSLVEINKKQFSEFLKHGTQNLCRVGDVFKVRQCYFEVETISEYGISAKGIGHHEYFDKKKRQMP